MAGERRRSHPHGLVRLVLHLREGVPQHALHGSPADGARRHRFARRSQQRGAQHPLGGVRLHAGTCDVGRHRVEFETELRSGGRSWDYVAVRQARRRVHPLPVEKGAIAALQIHHREFLRRFRIAHDLQMLAAHQVFPAGVEAHRCFGVAPHQDLAGFGGRKLICLPGPRTAEMPD